MALDAAAIVRAASAAMFVILGVAVVFLGRARPGPAAMGFSLALFGGANVARNLLPPGPAGAKIFEPMILLTGVALWASAILVPRPMRRVERPALLVGLGVWVCLLGLGLASERTGTISLLTALGFSSFGLLVFPLFSAALAVASTRIALAPPSDRAGWIASGALVGGLGTYNLLRVPAQYGDSAGNPYVLLASVVTVASIAVPFLVASARTRTRGPMLVAVASAGLGLASYLYFRASTGTAAAFFDPWGLLGVARLFGWAFLVHAILKADLLGVKLPRIAVARGPLAAGALATLFIVAQVAQNFLSDEYGLLMGGVVAGAFLFAASPLQRAAERLVGGEPAARTVVPSAPAPAGVADRREDVYRKALRLALKDGHLSREEETHLHELAEELGIPGSRAHALLSEIEHEARAARGVA